MDDFVYSWRRLSQGELPIPPLVKLGSVTRLFVVSHLTRRLGNLLSLLRQEDLRCRLEAKGSSFTADTPLRPMVTNVALLRSILTKRPGFKGAAVLTSLAGPLASAASAVGLTTLLKEKLVFISKVPPEWTVLSAIPWLLFAVLFLQVATIAAVIVISCFMQKRELMLRHDAFGRERALFSILGRPRPLELPFDLIVSILVLPLLLLVPVIQSYTMPSIEPALEPLFTSAIPLTGLWVLLHVWIWVRRTTLNRR